MKKEKYQPFASSILSIVKVAVNLLTQSADVTYDPAVIRGRDTADLINDIGTFLFLFFISRIFHFLS